MKTPKIINQLITVPNGLRAEVHVPDFGSPELIDLMFKAVLGSLAAIALMNDESARREFIVRYTSSLVAESNSLTHSCQLSNSMLAESSPEKAIEDLLKSLTHNKKKKE